MCHEASHFRRSRVITIAHESAQIFPSGYLFGLPFSTGLSDLAKPVFPLISDGFDLKHSKSDEFFLGMFPVLEVRSFTMFVVISCRNLKLEP